MRTRTMDTTRTFAAAALALPLALQTAGDADAPREPAAEEPRVERYAGTLAEGLAEIEALTGEARYEEALALADALLAPTDFTRWRRELEREGSEVLLPALELADPVLEAFGLNGYPEPLRAEVHYAEGLVRGKEGARAEAEDAFGRALALAGSGSLRLAAMYNRGQTALEEGEEWRMQIPEISGQQPQAAPVQPAPNPMGGAGPQPQDEEPDPLSEAREAYLRAREHLTQRLRADWRDEDTRANVELIQRRLKELDEIERQREDQQQDQQQDQQDEQQDEQQEQDQPDQGQGSDEDQEQRDEEEQQQQEEQPEESPTPEEQQQDEREQQEEPQPEEGESEQQTEEQEAEQQREAEPQEIYLTREEVQRLLQQLREHEEEGEMVRERLHRDLQRRVERDW